MFPSSMHFCKPVFNSPKIGDEKESMGKKFMQCVLGVLEYL
jgi:hypothetical protein